MIRMLYNFFINYLNPDMDVCLIYFRKTGREEIIPKLQRVVQYFHNLDNENYNKDILKTWDEFLNERITDAKNIDKTN